MSDMPDYVRAVYTSVKNTWQDAENLDDAHGYITYIWIPEETFKVDIMKLHIFSEKFRAFSKTVKAGGGTVKTTSAGGAHSHTVTLATSSAEVGPHTHQVVIGTKTSDTTGGYHRHKMFSYYAATPEERIIVFYTQKLDESTVGVAFTCAEDVDLYSWSAMGSHLHNVNIGTITSEAGGGSHSHTVSGQTAEAVANHTHTVTLADHTHEIDFGIYEEAIPGRTLSAILYDPDGTELKDFGVVLTGEDSDILDLSEYFETLKYGMYRIVLSASGRLRARLVFYELCKMYAQF